MRAQVGDLQPLGLQQRDELRFQLEAAMVRPDRHPSDIRYLLLSHLILKMISDIGRGDI